MLRLDERLRHERLMQLELQLPHNASSLDDSCEQSRSREHDGFHDGPTTSSDRLRTSIMHATSVDEVDEPGRHGM